MLPRLTSSVDESRKGDARAATMACRERGCKLRFRSGSAWILFRDAAVHVLLMVTRMSGDRAPPASDQTRLSDEDRVTSSARIGPTTCSRWATRGVVTRQSSSRENAASKTCERCRTGAPRSADVDRFQIRLSSKRRARRCVAPRSKNRSMKRLYWLALPALYVGSSKSKKPRVSGFEGS